MKDERTGWRDSKLSERHRTWGVNCPAVDIDLLMLEYNKGKASAIVEYKNEHAQEQRQDHPSYRALKDLADRANLPAFAVRYADDFSWWRVVALNARACDFMPANPAVMDETEWRETLWRTRNEI